MVASQAGDIELLVVVRRLCNNGQGVEWDSPAFATGAGDFVGAGVFAGGGVVADSAISNPGQLCSIASGKKNPVQIPDP